MARYASSGASRHPAGISLKRILAAACVAGGLLFDATLAETQDWPQVSLTSPIGGFDKPTHITNAGDGSGRLFVAERSGRIRVVKNDAVFSTSFLDLRARVSDKLSGVAFPPGYASRNHFYVKYEDTSCDIVVARYSVTSDPDVADPDSEEIILKVPQATPGICGHDGGAPVFGPDGFLYISLGDGSPGGGDPGNLAQDPAELLGKMLRIDVESGVAPYAIPATNPYASTPGHRGEIWASGLRNPWRFSFDQTGDLYIADPGQNHWEEVNYQPGTSAGGENYGWRRMEGAHCYKAGSCDSSGLTLPVVEYDPSQGCAVIGGMVYRGTTYPGLEGLYLYGDYCTGRIWGLRRAEGTWQSALLSDTTLGVVTFGQDEDGTVLVGDYRGGAIYRITDLPPSPVDLSIAKAGSTSGDGLIYTIQVTNSGSTAATGVLVTDELPAGVSVLSMAASHGSCSLAGSTVTCRILSLPGAVTATITVEARAPAGTLVNTVNVAANEPDPDMANNVATASTTVAVTADLVIEGLALSATSVAAGGSVTASYRVANRGTQTVTPTYTDRLYLSTDGTLNGAVLLGTSHGHSNNLTAGGTPNSTHSHSQTVTIPGGTPAGTRYLVVQADALGVVSESDEGNNTLAIPLTVAVPSQDLVIEGLALSATSVAAGGSVTASYRVANRGMQTVTPTYTERIYLSTDSTLHTPGDVVVGTSSGHTADLGPNATRGHSWAVTIPAGTAAPGDYYILVQADALGTVTENDEGNNVTAVAVTVVPSTKDLVITGLRLSAGTVAAGGSVTVFYSVKNQGTSTVTQTYTERIYLSADSTLHTPGDVVVGTSSGHTVDLGPNATRGYSRAVTIPAGTAPGNYYILAQADALGAVSESDEGNNVASVALSVTAP